MGSRLLFIYDAGTEVQSAGEPGERAQKIQDDGKDEHNGKRLFL